VLLGRGRASAAVLTRRASRGASCAWSAASGPDLLADARFVELSGGRLWRRCGTKRRGAIQGCAPSPLTSARL